MSDEGVNVVVTEDVSNVNGGQPRPKAFHLTRRLSVSATPLFTTIEENITEKSNCLDEATLLKINQLLEAFPKPPTTTINDLNQTNNSTNRQSSVSSTSSTASSGWGFKGIAERFFSKS